MAWWEMPFLLWTVCVRPPLQGCPLVMDYQRGVLLFMRLCSFPRVHLYGDGALLGGNPDLTLRLSTFVATRGCDLLCPLLVTVA